jgi:hypothetical protein
MQSRVILSLTVHELFTALQLVSSYKDIIIIIIIIIIIFVRISDFINEQKRKFPNT